MRWCGIFAATVFVMGSSPAAWAASALIPAVRLQELHQRIVQAEQELAVSVRERKTAREQMARLSQLMKLQKQERELSSKRLQELAHAVKELETRKVELASRLEQGRTRVRKELIAIEKIPTAQSADDSMGLYTPEQEKIEAPKRRLLANWVARGLREIEELKVDLQDSSQLEARISEERQALAALMEDLDEQDSILKVSRELQEKLAHATQREREARIEQIENYRRLKVAQSSVDQLVGDFNARRELERTVETEKREAKLLREMSLSPFAAMRGRLGLPVTHAHLVGGFGRMWDEKAGLHVFKKGIELSSKAASVVQSVFPGQVAFAGELPDYGKVAIVDHGGQFYTLVAHLGRLEKQAGQSVAQNERLGLSDESGTPIYFEIRAKNVPVNPLQWISPSINLR